MNKRLLTHLTLLSCTLLSTSFAQPVGSGSGGGTKQVCKSVQFVEPVVTGWDKYGFPIMHMELHTRTVCKTVPA